MNSTILSSVCGSLVSVHGCLEFHSGTESLGLQLGVGGAGWAWVSAELMCACRVHTLRTVQADWQLYPALLDP